MRDNSRIPKILSLLQTIWQQQPDVRFNQLISNLHYLYSAQNNEYGKRKVKETNFLGMEEESSYLDFFYLEDTNWEAFLESMVMAGKEDKETDEKLDDESSSIHELLLNNKYRIVSSHEECTHFYIDESENERLSDANLINYKLYPLYYDQNEDDYYIIAEDGTYCYSVDCIVSVKMLKRID